MERADDGLDGLDLEEERIFYIQLLYNYRNL